MLGNGLFIIYMIMCFAGLLGLIMLQVLTKHIQEPDETLLGAARNFMMAALLVGVFYFFTYYREMVMGQFFDGRALRLIDSVQFYVIALAWLELMYASAGASGPDSWRRASRVVFPILMGCSAAAYLFLLDGYYMPAFPQAATLILIIEAALNLSVILFTVVYIRFCLSHLTDGYECRYILIVSILININNIWNSICMLISVQEKLGHSINSSYLYAVTAILLLAVDLMTLAFFYRRDFSPIFDAKAGQPLHMEGRRGRMTETEVMDLAAEEHHLTRREREVMELAYQGMTNPEIAETLIISPHTVKRHMHNMFTKMGISTRVELVHLVSSYHQERE